MSKIMGVGFRFSHFPVIRALLKLALSKAHQLYCIIKVKTLTMYFSLRLRGVMISDILRIRQQKHLCPQEFDRPLRNWTAMAHIHSITSYKRVHS